MKLLSCFWIEARLCLCLMMSGNIFIAVKYIQSIFSEKLYEEIKAVQKLLFTKSNFRCGCDECVWSSKADSLRYSQARINAYKALSSPSLISLSSSDPVLTAFELSWDLRRLSRMETEFRAEYNVRKSLLFSL